MGFTRLDRLRNDYIRNRIGIMPCIQYIEKQQILWFELFMRLEHSQVLTMAYIKMRSVYRAGGDQEKGVDNIKDTLNERKRNVRETTKQTQT